MVYINIYKDNYTFTMFIACNEIRINNTILFYNSIVHFNYIIFL